MANRSATGKRSRFEARITLEQKELLQRAADLAGRSVTDFVLSSAQEAAMRTIRDHQVMELTARSSQAFASILANPPEPSERLRRAAKRYRQFTGER